ncbi:MAG: hypothetical protein U9N36_03430 [Euryarchaeota archaeon]|nr:hypothetical protein [Euryarchaeota archaeon]
MAIKKLAIVCILLLCLSVMPAMAQGNDTAANVTNATATATAAVTATVTPSTEPTVVETVTPVPAEAKFRVGPTVTLRPVNDVINKSQDGIVELYMYNPTVNTVTLTADVQVSVPPGIHVYGAGFGSGGAAGTVSGTYTVPPGATRTININIKSERTGTFTVHFTGLYWPGDDKDAFQQISLTHPLTVKEPSPKPLDSKPTEKGKNELPYTYIIVGCLAVIAIAFIALMLRKPPKAEVVIEEE